MTSYTKLRITAVFVTLAAILCVYLAAQNGRAVASVGAFLFGFILATISGSLPLERSRHERKKEIDALIEENKNS